MEINVAKAAGLKVRLVQPIQELRDVPVHIDRVNRIAGTRPVGHGGFTGAGLELFTSSPFTIQQVAYMACKE